MERYLTEFDTQKLPEISTQTVIIGAGIAGLTTAYQLIKLGIKPIIITKKPAGISNSFLAQGGIAAAVGKDDDPQIHYQDTIKAGRGICREKNVRILVEEGLERVIDLINIGVPFDRANSSILLTREGGHSRRRVLHAKDKTGTAIGSVLYQFVKNDAKFMVNYYLEEIITEDNTYRGVIVSDGEKKFYIKSRSLVIASGGYSPVFLRNTSAYRICGDVIGSAFRAGCTLEDLEFVQFHPTAIHIEGQPAYLITEAIRGEGAILVDEGGERFVDEMKPRDEVARAIFKKYLEGKKVFLNLKPLKEKGINLQERFPTVFSLLKKYKLEEKNLIPVSPAAHYSIGGIKATANGKTSVEGIFAVGEASCTGIHGANRLASNSLLECITFGYKTAYSVFIYNMYTKEKTVKLKNGLKNKNVLTKCERHDYLLKLKDIMWKHVGLERSQESLNNAESQIEKMEKQLLNYSNTRYLLDMIYVSKGIILSAKNRKESRGTHYRSDFSEENDYYKKHTQIKNNFEIKLEVN